jgi:hypothetical protein
MCLRDMRPVTASGEPISVVAGPWAEVPSVSAWQARRQAWPLAVAVLAGVASLLISGACLRPDGWRAIFTGDAVASAIAAWSFACDQLASIWGEGLLAAGNAPWEREAQPAWSMFWEFGLIACYGYVLARVSSRSFAWLAGARNPVSPLPSWRVLGMTPLLAVGGDVGANLMTLAAVAIHSGGADVLAHMCLLFAGVGAVFKFGGLLATLPLLALRCWIALPGVPRSRS